MKRILRLFACLLFLTATVVKAETLTNDSVIQLHKLGLADSTITAKIKASTCNFDTSMDALKALKDAGISDEVLQAMLLVSTPPAPVAAPPVTAPTPPGDPNDPKSPHTSGIYLYEEVDGKPKMTQMSPSRVEDVSSGGAWGVGFGGTAKTRAVLSGARAQTQLKVTEPIFYFYFAKTDASLGSMDVSATSPDDFSLGVLAVNLKRLRSLPCVRFSPPLLRPIQTSGHPAKHHQIRTPLLEVNSLHEALNQSERLDAKGFVCSASASECQREALAESDWQESGRRSPLVLLLAPVPHLNKLPSLPLLELFKRKSELLQKYTLRFHVGYEMQIACTLQFKTRA